MSKKNKIAILSVTNDLYTDQRMHKMALSLMKFGYLPTLVGVKHKQSKTINRTYKTKRFILPFSSNWLFYATYNIRLLLFLLFTKADVFVANDLDTLLANYIAYKIKVLLGNKNIELVYDSHELFTEVPELNGRKFVKQIWLRIEKFILPNLKNSYTVCQSIANYYQEKYKIKMGVIKNMPLCKTVQKTAIKPKIQISDNKKIILYQGALNIGRGIEHIIHIMLKINDAVLIIVGKGDIEHKLHQIVDENKLNDKVIFLGAIPLEQLQYITNRADIGLVLQEDISLSYRYVLPNRLFDFIKSKTPMLASNLPEIKRIIHKEKIGIIIDGFNPDDLLSKINELLHNKKLICTIKSNLNQCAENYCWESQELKLRELYLF